MKLEPHAALVHHPVMPRFALLLALVLGACATPGTRLPSRPASSSCTDLGQVVGSAPRLWAGGDHAARACDDAHRRAGLIGANAVELLEQGSTALGGDARCTVRAWRCAAPASP